MDKPTDKEMRDMGYQPPSNVGIIHKHADGDEGYMDKKDSGRNRKRFKEWEEWKDRLMDDIRFRKSLQWFRE